MEPTAPAPRPSLGRRLAVLGAYATGLALTSVSVGGLVGIGGVGVLLLPGAGTAGGAIGFGLGAGVLVAGTYVASGFVIRAIFSATHRAERVLVEGPIRGRGAARAGDLSVVAPHDARGALSPRRP